MVVLRIERNLLSTTHKHLAHPNFNLESLWTTFIKKDKNRSEEKGVHDRGFERGNKQQIEGTWDKEARITENSARIRQPFKECGLTIREEGH